METNQLPVAAGIAFIPETSFYLSTLASMAVFYHHLVRQRNKHPSDKKFWILCSDASLSIWGNLRILC
jgi:hypothetical protein